MKFKENYYNRPGKPVGDYNGGKSLVQKAGYRPNHMEIRQLILSGERHAAYRCSHDYNEDNHDINISEMDEFEKIDYAKQMASESRQLLIDRQKKAEAEAAVSRKIDETADPAEADAR